MSEARHTRDQLRQFAEAIKDQKWSPSMAGNWSDVCGYMRAADPKTILAMFEEIERLTAVLQLECTSCGVRLAISIPGGSE